MDDILFEAGWIMALYADQHDYKKAFKKHYHAYENWKDTGNFISQRLILVYCVECGLKFMVMKNERIINVEKAREDIRYVLLSHNFEILLTKYLHQSSYRFPQIKTVHGEIVHPASYHQACRYCLCCSDENDSNHQQFLNELIKVKEWIYRKV